MARTVKLSPYWQIVNIVPPNCTPRADTDADLHSLPFALASLSLLTGTHVLNYIHLMVKSNFHSLK